MQAELFDEGLVGIISVIAIAAGYIAFLRGKHLKAVGIVVTGFIYDYVCVSDSDGNNMYYPVVRFVTLKTSVG